LLVVIVKGALMAVELCRWNKAVLKFRLIL